MIVTIHQPNYLPWLGFFHKMALADRFVLLDTVPFSKNSFQNRCRIKSPRGPQWLTVPVRTKGRFAQITRDVQIDNHRPWALPHARTIEQNYGHTPFFETIGREVLPVYEMEWESLVDLNVRLIEIAKGALGISTPLIRASELDAAGARSELLLDVCEALGGGLLPFGAERARLPGPDDLRAGGRGGALPSLRASGL